MPKVRPNKKGIDKGVDARSPRPEAMVVENIPPRPSTSGGRLTRSGNPGPDKSEVNSGLTGTTPENHGQNGQNKTSRRDQVAQRQHWMSIFFVQHIVPHFSRVSFWFTTKPPCNMRRKYTPLAAWCPLSFWPDHGR